MKQIVRDNRMPAKLYSMDEIPDCDRRVVLLRDDSFSECSRYAIGYYKNVILHAYADIETPGWRVKGAPQEREPQYMIGWYELPLLPGVDDET